MFGRGGFSLSSQLIRYVNEMDVKWHFLRLVAFDLPPLSSNPGDVTRTTAQKLSATPSALISAALPAPIVALASPLSLASSLAPDLPSTPVSASASNSPPGDLFVYLFLFLFSLYLFYHYFILVHICY